MTFSRSHRGMATALLIVAMATGPAHAISLTFNYDHHDSPAFDPDGTRLVAMFIAAEQLYRSIFLTGDDYEFDIFYDDLGGDAFGQTQFFSVFDTNIVIDTRDSNGNLRNWFFDPTPLSDEEFAFVPGGSASYYGDLSPADQNDWFNGDPPDELEVGYRADALPGGPAAGMLDLWSTVIHEIGHVLGINEDVFSSDFHFDSDHIGGRSVVAVEDNGHLAARGGLMCGRCGGANLRRLPAATDILAMAGEEGISDVSLPRIHFVGDHSDSWNDPNNWIGGRVPLGSLRNDAFIRHGGRVHIPSGFASADNIFLESGLLESQAAQLTVEGSLRVSSTATLLARGTIQVREMLVNNGVIRPITGDVLTLTPGFSSTRWKLGGSGGGFLIVEGGDLVVFGPHEGTFDGVLSVGSGDTAAFHDGGPSPFEVGPTGQIQLIGGSQSARLTGNDDVIIGGSLMATGLAEINAPLVTKPSADIRVPNASDELRLNSPVVRMNGGTFSGSGILRLQDFAVIGGDTTIAVNTFDWDGSSGGAITNIGSAGTLTIDSQQIDVGGDGHDGQINLLGGRLVVNTAQPWRLEGSMTVTGGSRLEGQQLIIENGATLSTDFLFPFFGPILDAPIKVSPGGTIVAVAETLTLRGTTTLNGGSITGAATITQLGDLVVESTSSITTSGPFVWGGTGGHATTILDGAGLTISARSLSDLPFVSSYAGDLEIGDGGRLTVELDSFARWGSSGPIRLGAGATITGDGISNSGRIEGDGTINAELRNAGTVAPGDSVGQLMVSFYEQTNAGRLEIEIGGMDPGSGFDILRTNTASLDGTLSVTLLDGFLPSPGSRFVFLASNPFLPFSISGAFDALELGAPLGVGFDGRIISTSSTSLAFEVLQADLLADFDGDVDADIDDLNAMLSAGPIAGGVAVTPGQNDDFDLTGDGIIDGRDLDQWLVYAAATNGLDSPYVYGDANLDGVVDGSDFNTWNAGKFTSSLLWDTGDFNGDGVVDGSDFNLWNSNKFQSSHSLNAVPEPSTAASMMLVALVAWGAMRYRPMAMGSMPPKICD